MATSVMCNVVQLAQHPPPVHVPLEHMALPIPIPGIHALARRAVKERRGGGGGGGLRSHRPVFQPFQLKPWVRGQNSDTAQRESSHAVMGPRVTHDMRPIVQRSITAPPASVSSLEKKQEEEKADMARSSQSSLNLRDLLTPATKRSVATFPARPPISKGKQVPGRFFPKPILTEEQRAELEVLKRTKPPKAASLRSLSPVPPRNPDSSHGVGVFNSMPQSSVSRMDRQHSPSYNQRIARTRMQLQKERPETRSEVFAICFKQDVEGKDYDPSSELHSDYYSIKRLKMPMARLGRPVETNMDDFAVVLRGHRKHLHKKALLSADSDSLLESMMQPVRSRAGSVTRMTLLDEEESPRMVVENETPQTGDDQTPNTEEDETPKPTEDETPQTGEDQTPQTGEDHTSKTGEDQTPKTGEAETPNAGEDQTPNTGEDDTPKTGKNDTPQTGEGETPNIGEDETPQTGEYQTPKTGEDETPKTGEDQTPNIGEDETPQTGEDETPKTGEDQTPKTGEDQTHKTGESETPKTGEDDTLKTGEDETPKTGEDQTPKTGEDETPQTGEDQTPKTGENQTPKTGEDDTPKTGENDAPKTGEDQTPKTREDQTPQ